MEGKAAAEIDDAISSSHDVPKRTSLDRELVDQKENQQSYNLPDNTLEFHIHQELLPLFSVSFLDVLNQLEHTGRFNFTTQFPYCREVFCKPDLKGKNFEKNLVFDMDMSAGDFLALFYLLKLPVEDINLKAIFVRPTGWANAATIDCVYDLLHMMGRDDIPVGLDCVYDCLAHSLPRSPRRYGVSGYPTLKFSRKRNKAGEDYDGSRDVDDFVNFINQKCGTSRDSKGQFTSKVIGGYRRITGYISGGVRQCHK